MVEVATDLTTVRNTSAHPGEYEENDGVNAGFIITTAFIGINWPAAVSLNILVCLVIYRSRRLQSTTNYFIVSLAVSDLVFALFVMPFVFASTVTDGGWPTGGVVVCKLSRYIQCQAVTFSAYILIAICADRYYTIIYPLSFRVTRTRAKYMCFGSWIVAALCAAPGLYLYDVVYDNDVPFCRTSISETWQGVIYATFVANLTFVVPVAALCVGYAKLSRFIWTLNRHVIVFQRTRNLVPRCKVKTVKMLLIVTTVCVLLMVPYVVIQLCHCSPIHKPDYIRRSLDIFTYCLFVYFTSAIIKPVLYLCYNSNFRRGCKEIFCMSTMKCYRLNAYAITGSSQMAKRNYVGVCDSGGIAGQLPRADTPSKTFNRSARLAACTWPMDRRNTSTTV